MAGVSNTSDALYALGEMAVELTLGTAKAAL